MSSEVTEKRSWRQVLLLWLSRESIAMLFLGFAAGLPLLLIFSTLSVWLTEAGIVRSTVTFFSWAALGYSFKFLWAPIVDMLPVPFLTRKLGRRKAWLLIAQCLIILAIVLMAMVNPATGGASLLIMAGGAVLLGFSSATQDIVIDAFRIECAESDMQALLASMYIAGYRLGMLVAGAGALILAELMGTAAGQYSYLAWQKTYLAMACVMLLGVATTFSIREPEKKDAQNSIYSYGKAEYGRFILAFILTVLTFALVFFYLKPYFVSFYATMGGDLSKSSALTTFMIETFRFGFSVCAALLTARACVAVGVVRKEMFLRSYIAPVRDFFSRYSFKVSFVLLLLIGFYRVSDIVLGVVSNVFYVDLGFSKAAIAAVTKTFGLAMTLLGGFVGGFMTARFGVFKILFLGALLSAGTNLLFVMLARTGSDINMLTAVIAADNLSAGIATTAFVAFLSSLTNVSFTAMQYALFSSLMTLFPKLFGGYSGTIISTVGYEPFFMFTALAGVPVLVLVWLARKMYPSQV